MENENKKTKCHNCILIVSLIIFVVCAILSMSVVMALCCGENTFLIQNVKLMEGASNSHNVNTLYITSCVLFSIGIICCTILFCVSLCIIARVVKCYIEKAAECENTKELFEYVKKDENENSGNSEHTRIRDTSSYIAHEQSASDQPANNQSINE